MIRLAQMELPAGFDAVEAHPVTGHDPRAGKRPEASRRDLP